jgi:hypothetical protein
MRTTAGPALLAVRGRISGAPRIGVLVATAGEFATDKTSIATDRTDPPAVAGRAAAGAFTGRAIAGGPGIAAGATGAVIGSYSTWRIRKLVVETTGLPDAAVAVGEDVLAIALAAVATRNEPVPDSDVAPDDATDAAMLQTDTSPPPRSVLRDSAIGLAAGIAGTATMTIAQGAEFVLTDAKPSSSPADVAAKLKRSAGRGKLKRSQRRAANQAMHWLYGTSWGIPYGLVAAGSKVQPEVSGPVFGLLVWGAALAHEPALGIADVPWKRSVQSLGSEALFHVVYGIGAGAALRVVRNALAAPRGD